MKPFFKEKENPEHEFLFKRDSFFFSTKQEALAKIDSYMDLYDPHGYQTRAVLEFSLLNNKWEVHFRRLRSCD